MRVSVAFRSVLLSRPRGQQQKQLRIGERADRVVFAGLEIDERAGLAVDGFGSACDRDATADDFDQCSFVDGMIAHLLAGTELDDNGPAFRLGKEHARLRAPDRRNAMCVEAGLALVLLVGGRRERR